MEAVLLFSLLPVLGALSGALVAAWRPPGQGARSYIQHFAAGVVFSLVAVELLPDIMRRHEPIQVVIGFTLGVLAMLGVRKWSEGREEPEGSDSVERRPLSLAMFLAIGIDVAVDGLLLGIGFAASHSVGTLLAVALTVELLSLGLALATELGHAGVRAGRMVLVVTGISLLVVVGALFGFGVVQSLPEPLVEVALSFGLAALLFLVTEELLVKAHESEETLGGTAAFFAGFLLFLVIGMLQ